MSNIETLVNKKRPHSFSVGEYFVVKVAKSVVGRFTIVEKRGTKYAKGTYRGVPFNEAVEPYFLDDETFYGKAIYKVEERKNIAVFDLETEYPNHREALVGKQFVTGKKGEVYIARAKVDKSKSDDAGYWGTTRKPSDEIDLILICREDRVFQLICPKTDMRTMFYIPEGKTLKDTIIPLSDHYLFRLLPVESESKEGVIKTVIEEERYIVWTPSSIAPPQQIFTSAKQARYVSYRMTEQHKATGAIFYWAKLEGHAQWGNLNNG